MPALQATSSQAAIYLARVVCRMFLFTGQAKQKVLTEEIVLHLFS